MQKLGVPPFFGYPPYFTSCTMDGEGTVSHPLPVNSRMGEYYFTLWSNRALFVFNTYLTRQQTLRVPCVFDYHDYNLVCIRDGEDFHATKLNGPKICIKVDKSSFFKTIFQNLQAAKPTSPVDHNTRGFNPLTPKKISSLYFNLSCLHKSMISSTHKLFILLACIGILATEPYIVSGFRGMFIELPTGHRMLKEVSVVDPQAKPSAAALNKKFDPYQSSKRPVRRGSDPIHNRS
ncbi:hypothetical protein R6Q59_005346 [Mikania micrantha]